MWIRVHDPSSVDYESKPLVWLLLVMAWREREHIRVLAVYRDFEEIFLSSWDDKWRERVEASIDDAEADVEGRPQPKTVRDYAVHRDYRPPRE